MNTLIVGGNPTTGHSSSVINKLAKHFKDIVVINGRSSSRDVTRFDLVLWMPDIPNSDAKDYPQKKKGACLVCSKVMRPGVTRADAVSRIFRMHGNAVIAIWKDETGFIFDLIDALGNSWYFGSSIELLANAIKKFHVWSRYQKRAASVGIPTDLELPKEFIGVISSVAKKVQGSIGSRFFGNFSTRCMALFPSMRVHKSILLVSPRNIDKRRIRSTDAIPALYDYRREIVLFAGNRKPSVDTPIQAMIYGMLNDINFMIHGHAFIEGAPYTKRYFPCGDLRELGGISRLTASGHREINLKNHGFLIMSSKLEDMRKVIEGTRFLPLEVLE